MNGTLLNFDLEDNLITVGNYTIYPDTDDNLLCYEKESYDYNKAPVPSTCNSFYVTEAKGESSVTYVTEQGCMIFGNDCEPLKDCDGQWQNWFSAKITNDLADVF